jgi:hypothetical protein
MPPSQFRARRRRFAKLNFADARQECRCPLATSTVICKATVRNAQPAKLTNLQTHRPIQKSKLARREREGVSRVQPGNFGGVNSVNGTNGFCDARVVWQGRHGTEKTSGQCGTHWSRSVVAHQDGFPRRWSTEPILASLGHQIRPTRRAPAPPGHCMRNVLGHSAQCAARPIALKILSGRKRCEALQAPGLRPVQHQPLFPMLSKFL